MAENFGDSLKKVSELWDNTKPQSQDVIPDGTYQFRINAVELISLTSKEDPNEKIPCFVTEFECLNDIYKGKIVKSWDRLNKTNSIQFFKEKLRRLGVDPMTPIDNLELVLKDLIDCLITAKITNKQGTRGDMIFTNIYIQSNDGKIGVS